jgi:type IV secretion system protein VirB1
MRSPVTAETMKSMLDFIALSQQCAPHVDPTTLQALVRTESAFNPYAIGVVGGRLEHQPRNRAEAIATAEALDAQGINFSVGLGQVNKSNLSRYGLNYQTAFDLCANLQAGANILRDCYTRAATTMGVGNSALRASLSCYYSGNFTRGFKPDFGGTSYVERVSANAESAGASIDAPAIPVVMNRNSERTPGRTARTAAPINADTGSQNSTQPTPKSHPYWDAFGDYVCDGSTSCK